MLGGCVLRSSPASLAMALALSAVSASSAQAAQPARSLGCDTPESHQLDFWVGRWSVSPKGHPSVHLADSLIEKLYAGCVLRENWMPLQGGAGGSLSAYDPNLRLWKQTWADSSGSWVEFSGGREGGSVVIQGVWPAPGAPRRITRMRYTPLSDGTVEQTGVISDDDGKSWKPSFSFIYTRVMVP